MFLVLKEALANVVRHANATRVTVELRAEAETLALVVIDDGRGLPVDRDAHSPYVGGKGMSNMRRRAEELHGALTVERLDAGGAVSGTRVHLIVPWPRTTVRGRSS